MNAWSSFIYPYRLPYDKQLWNILPKWSIGISHWCERNQYTVKSCVYYAILEKTHPQSWGKNHRSVRIYTPKKCWNLPEFDLSLIHSSHKILKNLAIHIHCFENKSNMHPIYSYMKFMNLTVTHILTVGSLLSGRNTHTQKYCI